MALSKEQAAKLITDALDGGIAVANHASTHSRGEADEVSIINLNTGAAGNGNQVVTGNNDGEVVFMQMEPLFVTDILSELEDENNWTNTTYNASSGYAGQRTVSTDKHYFYECITDNTWVRYGIALTYFNAYLTSNGNDLVVRNALEYDNNWESGNYVGDEITGTYQGQAHYNAKYKFDAVDDNIWIRTPRQ